MKDFETQKRHFFSALALSLKEAMRMHEESGLWEKDGDERDWSNVSHHCLMEAARAEILAEWLELPEELKQEVVLAATLHDFNKKEEILALKAAAQKGVLEVVTALYKMEEKKIRKLSESGFSEKIINLVGVSGAMPETLIEIKEFLSRKVLSADDLSFLIIHYIDAYTRDSNWVEASDSKENDLDRRVEGNKKYGELDKAIMERVKDKTLFNGKAASQVMGELGHEIERLFVKIIFERTGRNIKSLKLPETIDEEIKKRITAL